MMTTMKTLPCALLPALLLPLVVAIDLNMMDVSFVRNPSDHAQDENMHPENHFGQVIPLALSEEEAKPFLELDYFKEEEFEVQPMVSPYGKKMLRGFSTDSVECGSRSIIYVRGMGTVDGKANQIDNMGFQFGLDEPTTTDATSRFLEVPVSKITDGVNARVLVGKAFGVHGFHTSTIRAHIIDFELDPFSYFTIKVPQDIDVAFAFVYDGTITRINEDPDWIGAQNVIVMDAATPNRRGMSFETQGEGCKFLLLASSKNAVGRLHASEAAVPEITLVGNVSAMYDTNKIGREFEVAEEE